MDKYFSVVLIFVCPRIPLITGKGVLFFSRFVARLCLKECAPAFLFLILMSALINAFLVKPQTLPIIKTHKTAN